jgi:hypothetical protein
MNNTLKEVPVVQQIMKKLSGTVSEEAKTVVVAKTASILIKENCT